MIIPFIMFALGLVLLIKGGDWFVDGSVGISRKFHIPEIIIGATIVSIGTTLPEVMVSATDALNGSGQIAYGNAIGSIICNTALISAITIAIAPCVCKKKDLVTPVLFFFGSAVFYAIIAIFFKEFSRITGIILLLIFVGYMVLTTKQGIQGAKEEITEEHEDVVLWKSILFLILGAAFIAVGANWLVHYGTQIAEFLGVPQTVIALTFVALGTSLPELVTAITSLVKKHGALSLGNIIGANIFNLVLVSGLSITLRPFALPAEKTIAGLNASLIVDLPIVFIVMGILTIPPLVSGKLKRWQGITLLTIYAAFCTFQFFF